jgi:hypothetical protein
MLIRKAAFIASIILMAVLSVRAASPGNSAFPFLKINTSARSSAMGELSCVLTPQNVDRNPATLGWLDSRELCMSYVKYLLDTNYSVMSFITPVNKESSLGVSAGFIGTANLVKTAYSATSASGYTEEGGFGYSDMVINAGYGMKLGRDLAGGASLRYAQETIDSSANSSAMLSLGGFYYPWGSEWQVSFGVNNIGSAVKGFDLPTSLYIGAGKQFYQYLYWGAEAVMYTDTVTEIRTGFEYNMSKSVFFRLGYRHLLEDQKLGDLPMVDVTGGLGFIFNNISFDYAWVPYGDLSQTHRISLGYKF